MKSHRTIFAAGAGILLFVAWILGADAQMSNTPTSEPVYVADYSHAGEPLPDGVLNWNAILQQVDATDGDDFAHFTFYFTNVAQTAVITLTTNSANTVTATTNFVPSQVVILNVHPSCGCTTAELPPTPWIIPPGSNEMMKVKVNLAGKNGVVLKSVAVTTDHGQKNLQLSINIHPAPAIVMTDEQKMAGIAAAKADRQAIFKGDCASCHIKKVEGLYSAQLFTAVCAVCHESPNRASMVPDLGNLKVPTNPEFWRTWITFGKPGSLMPAFAQSQGGPLTDMQIVSLAQYLNLYHPSKAPQPPQ